MKEEIKKNNIDLVLTGVLSLFLELSVIRWLPSNIFSLAYFSNIVLISSFLGISLGFIIVHKKWRIFDWFPLALLMYVSLILFLRGAETIVPDLRNEIMWSFYRGNQISTGWFNIGMTATLFIVFIMNTFLFAFIGEKLSDLMGQFKPLRAYTLDIIGSILGVLLFTFLSFAGGIFISPVFWFSVIGFLFLILIRHKKINLIFGSVLLVISVGLIFDFTKDEIWSPYYSVKTMYEDKDDDSIAVFVNRFFFQKAINFDIHSDFRDKYEVPYKFLKPESVLILGAGSGNDVAIATMNNVPDIDAVELDPLIYKIGVDSHPNKPYQNKNVQVYIDDARSFLRKNDKKYDLIVIGTLDSHALLSAKSTVRLDNFVYTTESLSSIKEHLSENGVTVLMFSIPKDWLGRKLIKGVQSVYGIENTIVFAGDPSLFNLMIMAGPGVPDIIKNNPNTTSTFKPIPDSVIKNLSTDDWPYLYIKDRKISDYYIKAILVLLALSISMVLFLRNRKKQLFSYRNFGFFALGMGFLLLETKSITTMSLLFGSTWIVNSFVFLGVLIMVLLANILVSKYEFNNQKIIYALLTLSLLINYLIPIGSFLSYGYILKAVLSTILISFPIFFASLLFSTNWKDVKDIESAYSMNLLGVVFGGFLEYTSMIFGINFLYIIAIIIYLSSFTLFYYNDN